MGKTRITLSDDRRKQMRNDIQTYFEEHHDETIGDLRAGLLLDFFLQKLGPSVYNQAIGDAQAYLQQKLEDLEIEYFEPEV